MNNLSTPPTNFRIPAGFPKFFSKKDNCFYELDDLELKAKTSVFSVEGGIPRFVNRDNYASAFGSQWIEYQKTQLDSFSGHPITENRIKSCLGNELFEFLKGKLVLEAGCGAGRFTEILLKQNSKVVSFDLSDAVDANYKNFPTDDNHLIIQADINNLPFENNQFDVVFCLGVVQHTPNPEQTIESLFNQVKPGGWLVIDHYTYNLSHYTKTSPILRHLFFKHLSAEKGMIWTKRVVNLFFPLHKLVRNYKYLQMILSRVSPVITTFHVFPELTEKQQYEWSLLDTHDTLTDYYKHFRTKAQIINTLKQLGAKNIHATYSGNGVEARCQK
jgi:2-polyprenyl-3-methyl-5-hydroxy-6-metoxy-1,4-benzoquinol methylase